MQEVFHCKNLTAEKICEFVTAYKETWKKLSHILLVRACDHPAYDHAMYLTFGTSPYAGAERKNFDKALVRHTGKHMVLHRYEAYFEEYGEPHPEFLKSIQMKLES